MITPFNLLQGNPFDYYVLGKARVMVGVEKDSQGGGMQWSLSLRVRQGWVDMHIVQGFSLVIYIYALK